MTLSNVIFAVILAVALGFFARSAQRLMRWLKIGHEEIRTDHPDVRTKNFLLIGLAQTKILRDPIGGMSYIELLQLFEEDPETEGIVMIGEIGGDLEIRAAQFVKENIKKPVAGFIAGQTAPKGKRMGHAGAIISGSHGTAAEKMDAMRAAGIAVAESPADIGKAIAAHLNKKR